MSSSKLLPVRYPEITCFPYYADVLSIVGATSDYYAPWVLSNFIQLSSHPDHERNGILKLDFFQPWVTWSPFYCPLIDVQIINKEMLHVMNKSDVITFITDAIDMEFYVHMKVNHKYLPISRVYQKRDMGHDLLIFGFDKELRILDVADNFTGKFEYKKCTFEEFLEAYNHQAITNLGNYEKVLLIKANKTAKYEFDLLKIADSLNDFLASRDTRIRDDQSLTWAGDLTLGINTYDKIIEHLDLLLEGKTFYDHKPFHVLWEHKRCMVQRIELMMDKKIIREQRILASYKEIEDKTLIFRNIILKYSMKPDPGSIHNLKSELQAMKLSESALIHEILEQIQRNVAQSDQIILGNNMNANFRWELRAGAR
ncbi:hypothetical protein [Candidatus Pristimantibacillus sp. PTI5]|uniref:hypothetical protein n=1 Tax=Candidatus Pristimantibacillus sp. PTI5 TaxID=3400422 RepID=UPI003B01FC02